MRQSEARVALEISLVTSQSGCINAANLTKIPNQTKPGMWANIWHALNFDEQPSFCIKINFCVVEIKAVTKNGQF